MLVALLSLCCLVGHHMGLGGREGGREGGR